MAQLAAEKLKEDGLCSYCCVKKSSTDEGMARGFPTTTYTLLSLLHETQWPQNHQDPAGPTHIFMFSFFFFIVFPCHCVKNQTEGLIVCRHKIHRRRRRNSLFL